MVESCDYAEQLMPSPVCGGEYKFVVIRELHQIILLFALLFPTISLNAQSVSVQSIANDTIFIYNSVKILVYGDDLSTATAAPIVAPAVASAPDTAEFDIKPIFALRSNLLLPLLNVGIQIPLGNRLSIGADWYYPFIRREWSPYLDQTNCFQALGPGIDFRVYLGRKHRKGRENWQYRLSGHSLGLNPHCS